MGSGSFEEADEGIERGLELIRHVIGAQFSGPIHGAAVERELWRHDPRAAVEFVDRGMSLLADTADWMETWRLCRVGAWAAGDLAEAARAAKDESAAAEAVTRIATLQAEFDRAWPEIVAWHTDTIDRFANGNPTPTVRLHGVPHYVYINNEAEVVRWMRDFLGIPPRS